MRRDLARKTTFKILRGLFAEAFEVAWKNVGRTVETIKGLMRFKTLM